MVDAGSILELKMDARNAVAWAGPRARVAVCVAGHTLIIGVGVKMLWTRVHALNLAALLEGVVLTLDALVL